MAIRHVLNETPILYEKYLYQMRFHLVRHFVLSVMFFYKTTYGMMIWYVIWYTVSIGLMAYVQIAILTLNR